MKCDYCDREFIREKSFNNHLCKEKERFLEKDEPIIIFAHKICNLMLNHLLTKEKFRKNRFYNNSVKVAKFLAEIDCINPYNYIKWLLEHRIPLKKWDNSITYEDYINIFTKKEHPKDAIDRSLIYINDEGKLGSFFSNAHPNWVIDRLKSGRISLWLILLYHNNEDLFSRFDSWHKDELNKMIGIGSWQIKLNKFNKEVRAIKKELEGEII